MMKIISTKLKDNKGREFILGGRPDIVIQFDDNSYGVIDFKTTNLKDNKSENYRFQLEAYKKIFTYPGSTKTKQTPKLSPINHMGVLQFFPNNIFEHSVGSCKLNFSIQYSKLIPNDNLFYERITYILDILHLEKEPDFSSECSDCEFVKSQTSL